jgi:inositol transport system substrate-binding protein
MKKTILAASLSSLLIGQVQAESLHIGVSMAAFDDNFLTILRNTIENEANKNKELTVQVEDAKNEVGQQLNQIQNFIASGVDAIIINAVDTDATVSITDDAHHAGIPLIYVNRQPINVDSLPEKQAFIASEEVVAGKLQGEEVCRQLKGTGNAVILMGGLDHQASIQRTQGVLDVFENKECSGIKIVEKQVADWNRTEGNDLMTNWLSAGVKFDAVIANNDEMAIGAIQAMKAVGINMEDVIVAGVDATPDALRSMMDGDLDITVFQSAAGQGKGALDAAIKLVQGQEVAQKVWIPFELVTPDKAKDYL